MKELVTIAKLNKNIGSVIYNRNGYWIAQFGDTIQIKSLKIDIDNKGDVIPADSFLSFMNGGLVDNLTDFELKEIIKGEQIDETSISGEVLGKLLNATPKGHNRLPEGFLVSKNHFVSIDGRQMYAYEHGGSSKSKDGVIVDCRYLKKLKPYLVKQDYISMNVFEKYTIFTTKDYEIAVRNVDTAFVSWFDFIPETNEHFIDFNRDHLLKAIDDIKLAIDKYSNKIVFKIDSGKLYLMASKGHSYTEMMSSIWCNGTYGDFFGLNYKMLVDILKSTDTEAFLFNNGLSPFQIQTSDKRETIILMPMATTSQMTDREIEVFEAKWDKLRKTARHIENTILSKKIDKILNKSKLSINAYRCPKCGEVGEFIQGKAPSHICEAKPVIEKTRISNNMSELESDLRWALAIIGELIPDTSKVTSINERINKIKNKL